MSSRPAFLSAIRSRLGLEAKFVLLASLVFISAASIANRLILSDERNARLRAAGEKAKLLAESMAIPFTHTLLFEEIGLVEESGMLDGFIRDILKKQELDIRSVMVLDPEGRVIAHNDYREYGKSYADHYTLRALSCRQTLIQRYPRDGISVMDIATPLQISYKRWGTLRLIVSLHSVEAKLRDYARRLALLTVVGALICIGIALGVARTLARPIKDLSTAMQEVGPDFRTDFKADRSDEIGHLQRSFLKMVDRLRTAVQEQARMQRMLIRANRLASLGTMAAGVAHEISNPLTGVRSCVERIDRQPADFEQIRRYTGLMMKSLDRAEKVVRGMLDFARQEDVGGQTVQLTDVLREAMVLTEHRLRRNQIELKTEFAPGLPEILGDSHAIGQVFLNLVLNAVDAMPDGGRLHISCLQVEEHLVVTVRDTGCGIPEDRIDRIFDPFYTTKGVGEGTGLGLSIAHGIVKEHGGCIRVESEAGNGSTFYVYFPVPGRGENPNGAGVTDRSSGNYSDS